MCIDPVTDLVAPKNLIFKVPPLISTGCWIPYVMKGSLEHKFISNVCQVTKDQVECKFSVVPIQSFSMKRELEAPILRSFFYLP